MRDRRSQSFYRVKRLVVSVAASGAVSAGLLAASAQALPFKVVGTGGTLHVRTAPSLSAPAVTGLADGTVIDIVCQTTGDQVVGSNIWDQIDSPAQGYVADWYTTTPAVGAFSSNLLPQCGAPAPQPQPTPQPQPGPQPTPQPQPEPQPTPQPQPEPQPAPQPQQPSFADIAQSLNGQTEVPASIARGWNVGPHWSGFCEAFVGYVTLRVTGHGRGYGSALQDYNAHLRQGLIHHGIPPRGAVVYWNPPASRGSGHIGISLGGGMEISTYGFHGQDLPIQIHPFNYRGFAPYLGWAMP